MDGVTARTAALTLAALAVLPAALPAARAAAVESPATPAPPAAPASTAPRPNPLANPAPLDEAQVRATSAEILRGLDALDAALAKRVANRDQAFPADLPGRGTLLALEEQILSIGASGPAREQLAAVQKALDGHDVSAADALLRQVAWSLTRMQQRIVALGSYPARIARIDARAESLGALLESSGVQSPHAEAINRLERTLSEREARREFESVLGNELPALEQLYRVAQDDAFNAATTAALARPADAFTTTQRTAPCPPPSQGKPGVARPSIDAGRSASTDDFYPTVAAREGFEGRVVMRATISAEGCARSAQVIVSTGDAEVDASATRWTLEGAVFHPAVIDGRPRESSVAFNVRFRLTD